MFLYIDEVRSWRSRDFKSSKNLNLEICREADVVIEFDGTSFTIVKDRYGFNGVVEMYGDRDHDIAATD